MKRVKNLFPILISDENLLLAIKNVNDSHHYIGQNSYRRVNKITAWVEVTKEERVKELRQILIDGFVPAPMRQFQIYDNNAHKTRNISEPVQWPDQYIHHAVQQCLEPIMMRGMDFFCCGSIIGRGAARGIKYIKKWMKKDRASTKYGIEGDIYHFYENIKPEDAFQWFKNKVKDHRVLEIVWAIIKHGVTIGGYFSQWIANAMLQSINQKIRQSKLCSHYVRYIDNFTILGSNKRKLNKLLVLLNGWLSDLGLKLKPCAQVFRIDNRMISALGYRFDHEKTYLRKFNLMLIRRKVGRILNKLKLHKPIHYTEAICISSKLSQLCHCNSHRLRNKLYPKGFITTMKNIARVYIKNRRKNQQWSYIVLQMAQCV